MPTRIVLRDTAASQRASSIKRPAHGAVNPNDEEAAWAAFQAATPPSQLQRTTASPLRRTSTMESRSPHRGSRHHRKVMGFRSSILRDMSNRPPISDHLDSSDNNNSTSHHDNDFEQPANYNPRDDPRFQHHLSTEDIRASPRLLGYLFGLIASAVMLVSVVQFFIENNINSTGPNIFQSYNTSEFPADEFFHSVNGPVVWWKVWGAMAVAAGGVGLFLIIVLMHVDTICFPKVWYRVFRDGSVVERNILFFLLVFWAGGLHVNTSSFSVGVNQANVFFTSWITFGCTALNMGVWRESADLPRIAEKILLHHRETTYNWCWTLLFVFITAGAATDEFIHRDLNNLRLRGEVQLDLRDWIRILAYVWADVLVCIMALVLNHFWTQALKIPICCGRKRCKIDWRLLEGFVILTLVAVKFWIILEYTGVDGIITGLNNAYFGVWGAFFNAVFIFGTWLRENKDIDNII